MSWRIALTLLLLVGAVVSGWSRLRSDSAFWAAASAGSMSSAAS